MKIKTLLPNLLVLKVGKARKKIHTVFAALFIINATNKLTPFKFLVYY